MALTHTAIHNAKAQDKDLKISDGHGLFLLIKPNGSKWWRYSYRFLGKQKTISLGVYPEIGLKDAREKHTLAKKQLALGKDPSEERKLANQINFDNATNSLEHIAREWWSSHMVGRKESHKNKVIRRFEMYLFPWLGSRSITSITSPELLKIALKLVTVEKNETAQRLIETCGQVWRFAVQRGFVPYDITSGLKGAIPATQTKHMATITDPEEIGALLRSFESFNGTYVVRSALLLAPLLFVRPGELRNAKWEEIDLNEAEWKFAASKTNQDHIVPLSSQAMTVLLDLKALTGKGVYVFPNAHNQNRPMSEATVNAALKRLGYDTVNQITGHGFRAMARTLLHEKLNWDPNVIEHQLAHNVPDALGRAYNRTKFLEQRKKMMQDWANYLYGLKAKCSGVTIPNG